MLEIQEKFSAEGYEALAERAGDKLHITEALDKGRVIGYIAYFYDSDRTVILDFDDCGDLYLCDGMVRSVLFKSCLKNIHTAEFTVEDEEKLSSLARLGFIVNGNRILENIDSLMDGCSQCRKEHENKEKTD